MTIGLAEQLIPWMDDRLIPKRQAPQTYEETKAEILQSVMDPTNKAQMKAFAERFKGKTELGQLQFLKILHHFTHTNFPYKQNSFNQQLILPPAVCFHQRSLGTECQNMTNWLCSILWHLPVRVAINLVTYKVTDQSNLQFIEGHVYPTVGFARKSIVMDATIPKFNQEVSIKKIKRKEVILCY